MGGHFERRKAYVLANPNAAGFLVEVDTLRARGLQGDDLENAIVDLAIETITMVEGRRSEG